MAKITTRKHVDPDALRRRLEQIDRPGDFTMRHNAERGEWEVEAAEVVSVAELQRVVADAPEWHGGGGSDDRDAAAAARRTKVAELAGKAKWTPADQEAATRLLLNAEMERG